MENYFIVLELVAPENNFGTVRDVIKTLGRHYQLQTSLFYLSTQLAVVEVHDRLREKMHSDDKLCVIDAAAGYLSNYPKHVTDSINSLWFADKDA